MKSKKFFIQIIISKIQKGFYNIKKIVRVCIEENIQHLTLYAPDCYDKLGNYAQMNPPLRDKSHYDRLWYAVRNNYNDTIGSDHAPHLKVNKDKVKTLQKENLDLYNYIYHDITKINKSNK